MDGENGMTESELPLYCGPLGFHQMGEGDYVGISAAEVVERMKMVTHSTNLYELAIHLKTSHKYIRDAKRRNIIPLVWIRELITSHGETSPAWIMTGRIDEAWNKGLSVCGGHSEDYDLPIQ